jgi:hypothetical protein
MSPIKYHGRYVDGGEGEGNLIPYNTGNLVVYNRPSTVVRTVKFMAIL